MYTHSNFAFLKSNTTRECESNLVFMSNISNDFIIQLKGGQKTILKKGMAREEVIKLLGQPSSSRACRNPFNEKLIFRTADTNLAGNACLVFFIRKQLEYVSKLT